MKHISLFFVLALVATVQGFMPFQSTERVRTNLAAEVDNNEIVGRRILVKGDVNGGYYRSCVLNEVSSALFKM